MKKILICTDGSGYSMVACRYGAWLARGREVAIDLLYVSDVRRYEMPVLADLSGSLGAQTYDGMLSQMQELEGLKSEFIWEQSRALFEAEGLLSAVQYHHETGLLVDLIGRYQEDADLIILGKRGENAEFAKAHMGSSLERMVRSVKRPCFVTNREFKPVTRIAVAFDASDSTCKALNFIAAVQPFCSIEIHLLSVAEGYPETTAVLALSKAKEMIEAQGLSPKSQLLTGEVETAIAGYVRDADIDLLVLGAYGHSRIRDFLIGSTTTELLRSCHVPVLCFH